MKNQRLMRQLYFKKLNKRMWFSAQNRYNENEKLNLKRSVFVKDKKCFIWLSWRLPKPKLKLLGHVVGLLKSLSGWWLIYSSTAYFTEHCNNKKKTLPVNFVSSVLNLFPIWMSCSFSWDSWLMRLAASCSLLCNRDTLEACGCITGYGLREASSLVWTPSWTYQECKKLWCAAY